jgi:uncharacterized protein
MTEVVKKKRGFAAMDPERVKEISSKGGKSAQEQGVAHRWTSEGARAAGRLGGIACHAKRVTDAHPAPSVNEPE